MRLLNYVPIIIFSLIAGFSLVYFPPIYAVLFLGAGFLIRKFELVLLANCLGFLYISNIVLSDRALTAQAILFLMLAISYFLSGNKLENSVSIWRDNLGKVVLLYFFWEVIQLIYNANHIGLYQLAKGGAVQSLILIGMFYITSSYIKEVHQLYFLVAVLLICATSESILAILQHYSPDFYITPTNSPRNPYVLLPREYLGYILPFFSPYVREARGTFGQFNGLGNFLTLFSPLAFAIAFVRESYRKNKYLFWFIGITIFLGLYFTYSRGSLSGVVVGLFLMILLLNRKSGKKELKVALILFILPLSCFVIYSLSGFFSEYYGSTQNWTSRLLIWSETLSHIAESPSAFLFGTHYIAELNIEFFQQLVSWTPLGHNSYLAIWEARGIIGLILVVLLFVFSLRNFYSSYKKTNNVYIKHISIGLIAGLVAFSISQLFDHKLAYFFDVRIYFFMILGISIGMKRIVIFQD